MLEILWVEEFYADSAVAALLGFGKKGPFQSLTKEHVPYYVDKFCLCLHHGVHGRILKEEPNPKVIDLIFSMSCAELEVEWDRCERSWTQFTETLSSPQNLS